MLRVATNPNIGIEHISPDVPPELLEVRARQLASLVANLQEFYLGFEGAERIATGPPPNPNDPTHVTWRMGRLQASGVIGIGEASLMYLGAFNLNEQGNARNDDTDLVGLLLLRKPTGVPCTREAHTPIEIAEFFVRGKHRGQGIGKFLLRSATLYMHPEDEVVLDVASPNTEAQEMYRDRYGFTFAPQVPEQNHGVFNFTHRRMRTSGRSLQLHAGIAQS